MERRSASSSPALQERSLQTLTPEASVLLHPLSLFSAVWLGVVSLYSLQLSHILRYTTDEVVRLVFWIWLPFAVTTGVYVFFHHLHAAYRPMRRQSLSVDLKLLRRRLNLAFCCWVGITVLEIAVSGGVPLVWALAGSTKTYSDFGVPSLHGLVNSLQTTIALCYFFVFLADGQRRDLRIPMFFLAWTLVIINRNMMLVTLLEFVVIYVRLRKVRLATFAQIGLGILAFILVFGVIGDVRQGSNGLIRDLAQPTENYPEWLPSGVLWGYIYSTTPINNLLYTVQENEPQYDWRFSNTLSTLFPSVLRVAIYGDALSDAESGSLVVSAFNVSTAYVGPYEDFGYAGITLFSGFIAALSLFFWFRHDLRSTLAYAVLAQCLILTLFFDHFFYLPVITQLGWLWLFFSRQGAPLFVPEGWRKPTTAAAP